MERRVVVGAAIVRDGRVLAARRTAPASAAGRWEFPGGKVEPGETDADSLVREIDEELGVADPGRAAGWPVTEPIGERYLLRVALASLVRRRAGARPSTTRSAGWAADELDDVDWLEADRPFLTELSQLLPRLDGDRPDPTSACSWSTPTPTTSRSGRAPRWRATSPRARGVTLVTCTAGEMGEILVPELEHLAADKDDRLGEHRKRRDRRRDGRARRHRPPLARRLPDLPRLRDEVARGRLRDRRADDIHDNAFWHADLTEAADHLVAVIREVQPQVLVTYDPFGGYGHPDHIQAHRVAMYAAQLAAVPSYGLDLGEPWEIAKIYWGAMSESRMRAGLRSLREAGDTTSSRGWTPTVRCRRS